MKEENLNEQKFLAFNFRKIPLGEKARRNPVREEIFSLWMIPVIDQRFDGIFKDVAGQARHAWIFHLVRQVMNSSKKQELMLERFPEEERTLMRISDHAKRSIQVQGIVEAFELLELTEVIVTSGATADALLFMPTRIPLLKNKYGATRSNQFDS